MKNNLIKSFTKRHNGILNLLRHRSVSYWSKVSEKETLKLFHAVSERVPAYKDFLKKSGINPQKIKTLKDFSLVPPINKNNYLRAYPYEKLVWDGDIRKPITIHSTSGSTGEPTYFQRDITSDLKRELTINDFFRRNKLTTEGPTLFIIAFGMGVWSAGMGIYTAAYLAINRNGYPISIITPGVNKSEVLKIFKNIASSFRQIIIAGYPPFVRDVIDDAIQESIDIKKLNLRFVFTGEGFTEDFRDYISKRAGISNVLIDTMNTYGTSEFGATAVETPLSIFVRRLANNNIPNKLFTDTTKTPTLAQYIPTIINFECVDGELLFTGDNTIPLVRYQSGDSGGIFTFEKLERVLSANGIKIEEEFKKLGISNKPHKLPFVYVYERKNLTTTLYGVLIYPEFIKTALLDEQLNTSLTGKFKMVRKYDKEQSQYLEINLELRKGIDVEKTLEKLAVEKIVKTLKERSSEFRELSQNLGEKVNPKLVFWPYEYQEHFAPGTKQKWVSKN